MLNMKAIKFIMKEKKMTIKPSSSDKKCSVTNMNLFRARSQVKGLAEVCGVYEKFWVEPDSSEEELPMRDNGRENGRMLAMKWRK